MPNKKNQTQKCFPERRWWDFGACEKHLLKCSAQESDPVIQYPKSGAQDIKKTYLLQTFNKISSVVCYKINIITTSLSLTSNIRFMLWKTGKQSSIKQSVKDICKRHKDHVIRATIQVVHIHSFKHLYTTIDECRSTYNKL